MNNPKFKTISSKSSTNIRNSKGHLDMTLPQDGRNKNFNPGENCGTNVIDE
jgi:hypothetical protein